MRRSMLASGGLAPFIIGKNPLVAGGSSLGTGNIVLPADNPAPRAGTVTSVTLIAPAAGSMDVFTCSLDTGAGSITVTAKATITVTTGLGTYPVSLACNAGDVIGAWSSGFVPRVSLGATTPRWSRSYGSTPTGTVTGLAQFDNSAPALQAMGS